MKVGKFDLSITQIIMIVAGFCILMMVIAIDNSRWRTMLVLVLLMGGLIRTIQRRRENK